MPSLQVNMQFDFAFNVTDNDECLASFSAVSLKSRDTLTSEKQYEDTIDPDCISERNSCQDLNLFTEVCDSRIFTFQNDCQLNRGFRNLFVGSQYWEKVTCRREEPETDEMSKIHTIVPCDMNSHGNYSNSMENHSQNDNLQLDYYQDSEWFDVKCIEILKSLSHELN